MPTSPSEGERLTTRLAGGRPTEAQPVELATDERSTLAALACGILVHDAGGAVVYANPVAERLIGMPAGRLRGRVPLGALWTAADEEGQPVPESAAPSMVALRTGRPVLGRVLSFAGPNGERSWAELEARPGLDAEGRVVRVVTTLTDVGQRKAMERQVAALGRLEPMRQLGEMASGIAHDVNHYLTLVAGHAEMALQLAEAAGGASEELRAALDAIVKAAMEGGATIRRLQTFGRPASVEPPTELVVGELLRDVAQMTQPKWRDGPQAEGRPIHLHVEVEGDTAIRGVEGDLREAFTNLIFNAVDAMPRGGTILLTARRSGGEVEVEVSDTGTGMSDEVQRRIFEPYFTTKGERGTGLGLVVVMGTIERHHARIQVRSGPGLGTGFHLWFPAAARAAPPPPTSADDPPIVAPMRVLVVDDEPDLTQLATSTLTRDGHAVVAAHSAEEALVRLADEPFDLVITDLTMGPGMTGWELTAAVRERYRNVRVILATGWGPDIDSAVARARGVETVIAKPYRIAVLRAALADKALKG